MKAIGLWEFGGPEVLRVVDLPDPEPGPSEVRIRVQAAGVNPTDITFRSGGRAAQLTEHAGPYVPGVDAAGIVEELGPGSDGRLTIGEPVIAFVVPMGPGGGSYAECIVVPEASVVPAPRGASIWEAATLLLNATAARLSLNALALSPGEMVAIVGGSGAVGGYAIQLATAEDGLMVLTNATSSDEELVRSLGADLMVETTGDIATEIRREVPDGVPGVIDGAGLNEAILPAIADGGRLATLKGWSGPAERNISIHPISSFDAATNTALLDHLRQLAEDRTITLRVAEVVPAIGAGEAQRRLAAGGLRGRLVLDFSEPL
jgi:NADPH:quinone reductase-like Zn-dependent oxidoreductase